jgi:hypothetical protein
VSLSLLFFKALYIDIAKGFNLAVCCAVQAKLFTF